jgi:hypothetical protein
MFRSLAVAAALIFTSALSAQAASIAAPAPLSLEAPADPIAGTYSVQGNPFSGGDPYSGEVTVEKTGSTYRVIWFPGADQVEGIGVYWGGQFSVGYLQNGKQGIAVYMPVAGGLKGVWSERGETRIAPEDWTKR